MAIAAIDPVVFHVMLMAEWNRLLRCDVNTGDPVAAVDHIRNRQRATQQQNDGCDRDLSESVRARSKQLWHTRSEDPPKSFEAKPIYEYT